MMVEDERFDLEESNVRLSGMDGRERVEWAYREFGEGLVMSTSFGVQSAVLLHMVREVSREIPVIFIDTGYHFKETYEFGEALRERLDLNLKVYQPLMTAARQEALYGERWKDGLSGLKAYNFDNKVEPMNRALKELGARAWMSGLRRDQSRSRAGRTFIELQQKTFKFYPILDWTDRDIYAYLQAHNLPYHPLWHEGYVSIGDRHSTRKLGEGMRAEETRFEGMKRECGLHEASGNLDYQI